MKIARFWLLFTLALLHSQATLGKALTPKELFSDDEVEQILLSPDGIHIAYVMPKDDTDLVTIAKVATMKPVFSFQMGENRFVHSIWWANNTRIVYQPAMRLGPKKVKYGLSDMMAYNFNGKRFRKLYGFGATSHGMAKKERDVNPYFYVQSILPDDSEHILLVTYSDTNTLRWLRKLNIYSGRLTRVTRSKLRRGGFITSREGQVVAQWGTKENAQWELIYLDKKGQWQDLNQEQRYRSISAYSKDALLLEEDAGSNKYRYLVFNRLTKKIRTIATSDSQEMFPIFDADNAMIGYNLYTGKGSKVFFDENSPEAIFRRRVEVSFPHHRTIASNATSDGAKRIVTVYADDEPGRYYLFDTKGKKPLSQLTLSKPKIRRDRFSKTLPIQFKSRDGLNIHGYISQPNNSNGADPMVVIVHGGPFGERDYWDFDHEVQLLTSAGYAVLRVNYRGSGGYGDDFIRAGHQQWGQSMQDDITDGTKWAIKQGFANKDKVCIYGASYGGYAALWGAIKEPELYKCAVGYVGVYDLPLLLTEGNIQRKADGKAYLSYSLGTDVKKLQQFSPSYHVNKLKAGAMLIHGDLDKQVPISHFNSLTKALDKINYPYEKLVVNDEGHGFLKNENEYLLYSKLVKFFDRYLK